MATLLISLAGKENPPTFISDELSSPIDQAGNPRTLSPWDGKFRTVSSTGGHYMAWPLSGTFFLLSTSHSK
jgi:hypothetical protein